MNEKPIVRIIRYSLILAALLTVLVVCLTLRAEHQRGKASQGSAQVQSGENQSFGSSVERIEIDWAAGDIILAPSDNGTLHIKENDPSSKYPMYVEQDGNSLQIRFCKDSITAIHASIPEKALYVYLPADHDWASVYINAASAEVSVSDLNFRNVEINTASGVCRFSGCHTQYLEMNSASGDLHYNGSLNIMSFDGASAKAVMELTNQPDSLLMNSMSGDLEVTLPEGCGFTASCDSLSGHVSCDMPTTAHNSTHVYGDGHCSIELSGLSANLIVHHNGSGIHHEEAETHHAETESHNQGDHHGDSHH